MRKLLICKKEELGKINEIEEKYMDCKCFVNVRLSQIYEDFEDGHKLNDLGFGIKQLNLIGNIICKLVIINKYTGCIQVMIFDNSQNKELKILLKDFDKILSRIMFDTEIKTIQVDKLDDLDIEGIV